MDDGKRDAAPADVPTYTIVLEWDDGRTERVQAGANESVLGAAETAGVSLPFGCLYGVCGTCTAQLLDGTVRHRQPPKALKSRHRENGYVLLCVATPTTDCHLRVGADVQAELVPNPWR